MIKSTPDRESLTKMDIYNSYKMEYDKCVQAYHMLFAEAQSDPVKQKTWAIRGRKYKDEIDKAMGRWEEFGFKKEIDAVFNAVDLELHLDQ